MNDAHFQKVGIMGRHQKFTCRKFIDSTYSFLAEILGETGKQVLSAPAKRTTNKHFLRCGSCMWEISMTLHADF